MKRIVLAACIVLALATAANAVFYECVGSNGNKIFTDTPIYATCKSMGGNSESPQSERKRELMERVQEIERIDRANLTPMERQQLISELLKIKAELQQIQQASRKSCEIVNFTQYEVNSGGGHIVGGNVFHGMLTGASVVGNKATCVSLTIRNNDRVERTINNAGIVAVTEKGNKRNPKGFMTNIKSGGMYQGDVCFEGQLSTISEMECKF